MEGESKEERKEEKGKVNEKEVIVNRIDDDVIEDGLGCCVVFCMSCFSCVGED